MSHRVKCIMLSLVIAALIITPASAGRQNYTFVNYSGRTIKNIYISASSENSWGSDYLGDSVLINGETLSCWYNDYYRYFDIKIVFMDNSDLIWNNYDFRGLWRLTFHVYDGSAGYALSSN